MRSEQLMTSVVSQSEQIPEVIFVFGDDFPEDLTVFVPGHICELRQVLRGEDRRQKTVTGRVCDFDSDDGCRCDID